MDCIGGTPHHIQCLVECECGLLPHLRDLPSRSSIRASGRSRSTTIKQARPVLLRSSRTPPYPSSTVLISRDPNPACRRCFTLWSAVLHPDEASLLGASGTCRTVHSMSTDPRRELSAPNLLRQAHERRGAARAPSAVQARRQVRRPGLEPHLLSGDPCFAQAAEQARAYNRSAS